MDARAGEPATALVLVRSASGAQLTPETRITVENVADHAPAPDAVDAVRGALQRAGFELGPLVGIGFAITGPPDAYERTFGVRVVAAPDGGWGVEHHSAVVRELPMTKVVPDLARHLVSVTFEPPAQAFGAFEG